MSEVKADMDRLKKLGKHLGLDDETIEKAIPSQEKLQEEFDVLNKIEKIVNVMPPKIIVGVMYYMHKGAPLDVAVELSMDAAKLEKEVKAKEGTKVDSEEEEPEDSMGAMLNV